MKWLAWVVFVVVWSINASAQETLDDGVPELIDSYIRLSCDAIIKSLLFQTIEIDNIKKRHEKCQTWRVKHKPKYGILLCAYVEVQRQYIYAHIKSLEKAFELVCNEDGTRKNPEYKIEF